MLGWEIIIHQLIASFVRISNKVDSMFAQFFLVNKPSPLVALGQACEIAIHELERFYNLVSI